MKVVILSLLCSIAIHLIYLIVTIGWAYVETLFFEIELSHRYENAYALQNEVAIGYVISPINLIIQLVVVAIIVALITVLRSKYLKMRARFK
nr:hypothetical protein [Lysinibacillus timonensis]